jgi:hypothetical protein
MIDTIEQWEAKGFRICIFPQQNKGQWLWTAGVYIGNVTTAHWADSNNGLPRAGYLKYSEALDAAVKFCENYKPKTSGKKAGNR